MRYLTLALLVILTVVMVQPSPVHAEIEIVDGTTPDWSAWGEPAQGTAYAWEEGLPFTRTFSSSPTYHIFANGYDSEPYHALGAKHDYDACYIETVTVFADGRSETGRMVLEALIEGEWQVVGNIVLTSWSNSTPWEFTVGLTVDALQIEFFARIPDIRSITVDGCGEIPPPTLMRPLATADEHEQWGMFDNQYVQEIDPGFPITTTYPYMIYALANQPNANVSSVADGKVIYVRPFDKFQDCSTLLSSLVYCLFIIPQPITQETSAFIFTFEMINISVIYIEDADDPEKVYKYYVANATVQTGDMVVAGCIIGQTIQLKNLTEAELSSISAGGGASLGADEISAGVSIGGSLDIRSLLVNAGVTIIHYFVAEERARLLPLLTIPPDQSNCKEETLSHCVNADSTMSSLNQDSWIATENGTEGSGTSASLLPGGGISISPYSGIIQQGITVDPEVTYTLNFQARRIDPKVPNEIIRVIVGDQVYEVGLTQQFINYTFTPASVFSPLPIVFRNETTSYIEIRYACLADSTTSTAPGACYFANNEFDADGASWLFMGTTFASGQAYMPDEATLGQEVTLYTNDDSSPHTYTISAQARLLANSNYTGQVGKSVSLEYQFPSAASYTTLGTIDSALVISQGLNPVSGAVQFDYPYQFSQTFEVSVTTISGFYVQAVVTDAENYITGLRLDWLCITPETDDGSFPGQPGDGGFVPPLTEGCAVVPLPIDGSVAA